ncbi:MAG TPA: histidine kinase [Flavobacteriales bacterium]|nr:histidine kinase [Flavobacteriales bacterium]
MNSDQQIMVTVVVTTVLFLIIVGLVIGLMFINAQRRHRFRAELVEADLRREAEVMQAEREATEQTLNEMGRELHDSVGQLLTVAQLGLLDRLDHGLQDDPSVATALGALGEGISEVRRLGRSLNSDLWKERSLVDALEAEAVRIERLGRGRVLLTVEGDPADPPADVKTVLFRTFQEVMNNALKHSGADTMEIGLSGNELPVLRIADNGRGFDPATVEKGGGLMNIRRRCELIGYRAELVSGAGLGCTWTLKPHDA